MAQESLHEKKQLEALEEAAQCAHEPDEPRQIESKAAEVGERRAKRLAWTLPYAAAAAVAGALLLLLEWDPPFLHLSGTAILKAQRYFIGALGVVVVLALARAGEVYWIERLPSPVSRFNLKRILRLLIGPRWS